MATLCLKMGSVQGTRPPIGLHDMRTPATEGKESNSAAFYDFEHLARVRCIFFLNR